MEKRPLSLRLRPWGSGGFARTSLKYFSKNKSCVLLLTFRGKKPIRKNKSPLHKGRALSDSRGASGVGGGLPCSGRPDSGRPAAADSGPTTPRPRRGWQLPGREPRAVGSWNCRRDKDTAERSLSHFWKEKEKKANFTKQRPQETGPRAETGRLSRRGPSGRPAPCPLPARRQPACWARPPDQASQRQHGSPPFTSLNRCGHRRRHH